MSNSLCMTCTKGSSAPSPLRPVLSTGSSATVPTGHDCSTLLAPFPSTIHLCWSRSSHSKTASHDSPNLRCSVCPNHLCLPSTILCFRSRNSHSKTSHDGLFHPRLSFSCQVQGWPVHSISACCASAGLQKVPERVSEKTQPVPSASFKKIVP